VTGVHEGVPERPSWRKMAAGLPVGLFLHMAHRRQLGRRDPFGDVVVILNDRSEGLVRRAEQLAAEDRADRAAVEELRRAARSKRHDLLVAASWFEIGGQDRESRSANLARRLLQAAAGDGDLSAMSAEEDHTIGVVEDWLALGPASRFQALVDIEPRLGTLEATARSEDFRAPADVFKLGGRDDPRRVLGAVHDLVGPHGVHKEHPLLGRTAVATDAARYLYDLIEQRGNRDA
jgi:hypothetical protein